MTPTIAILVLAAIFLFWWAIQTWRVLSFVWDFVVGLVGGMIEEIRR